MRQEIEKQGGLKLIYIDPPFDVGADFSMNVEIGDESFTKKPSVIEEVAYRDTWGKGADSFIAMIYERLKIMHGLLADDGSIYVHCDWRLNSCMRLVLDEIFGKENHINEIVWCYSIGGKGATRFGRKHDTILYYGKSNVTIFNGKDSLVVVKRKSNSHMRLKVDKDGREYQEKTDRKSGKVYRYYVDEGKIPEDYWIDIEQLNREDAERIDYPTQKPAKLIEKIVSASSYIVETKGREDLDDPLKITRLAQWCDDANNRQKKIEYKMLYVKQEDWDKYKPKNWNDIIQVFSPAESGEKL